MTNYSDRHIHSVDLGALVPFKDSEGVWMNTHVRLDLSGVAEDIQGPSITVELGFPVTETSTLHEIRETALETAHAILSRWAVASIDDIKAAANKAEDTRVWSKT